MAWRRRGLIAGLTLAFLILWASLALAGPRWLSLEPSGQLSAKEGQAFRSPELATSRPGPGLTRITLAVFGLWADEVQTKAGAFTKLELPGFGVSGQIGQARLPVIRKIVRGPKEARLVLSQAKVAQPGRPLSIKDLGLPERILPVQPSAAKIPGGQELVPFVMDEEYYRSDELLPAEPVKVIEVGIEQEERLYLLEFYPVRYRPASGEIVVSPRLSIELEFTPPEGRPKEGRRPKVGERLLVIYDPLFSQGVQSLVEEKQARQYSVSAVSTAQTGASAAQIKAYIQSLYNDPASRPDFVILVGDTDRIPYSAANAYYYYGSLYQPTTDLYYACLDGADDWLPDLAIGRISVASAEELSDYLAKATAYENGSFADPSYLSRAVFMASSDNYQISEGSHNYVIETYLTPRGYSSDRLYSYTYSATTAQVTSAFNSGRIWGIYSGHGNYDGWYDGPPFYSYHLQALANTQAYPFISSFACLTGKYEVGECFAETWIRLPNAGAVVYWGSSTYTNWDEDDVLEKGLFQAVYAEGYTALGQAVNQAKEKLLEYFGSSDWIKCYFERYNLFGDPSLTIQQASAEEGVTDLYNGQSLAVSLTEGESRYFRIFAPSGASDLWIRLDAITGLPHLYTRFGQRPDLVNWDCHGHDPATSTWSACWYETTQVGYYYILVYGQAAGSATLSASYSTGGGGQTTTVINEDLSLTQGEERHFSLSVPSGATNLTAKITNVSGDPDLYTRFGARPTTSLFDCRPYYPSGREETCSHSNPTPGAWYVMVRGYSSTSICTLTVTYTTPG